MASNKPMPEFVPPQLCETADHAPDQDGWLHEIKLDGYRIQIHVAGHTATLRTRKGIEKNAPDFAALQAALSAGKTGDLVYFAFDLLFDGSQDLRKEPLVKRKAALQKLLKKSRAARLQYSEHFDSGGDAVLQSACKLELEGIVSKQRSAPYVSGRTSNWLKIKCRAGHEVVIGGWTTTGAAFRSLLVGVHRDNQFIACGISLTCWAWLPSAKRPVAKAFTLSRRSR
jgi:bifunctional non-homologous end joining protein LigD